MTQPEQNYWADFLGKPECKDQYFRTLVSWMACMGADFDENAETHLRRLSVNKARENRTVLHKAAYMDNNGVRTINIKQHSS